MLSKIRHLNLPIALQLDLFDKLVLPVLTYGCEVWGHSNLSPVELFHRKCLKVLLKISKFTATPIIHGETGRYTLETCINSKIIRYWNEMKLSTAWKISTVMFKFSIKNFDRNTFKTKWLTNIKRILDNSGLPYLWNSEGMNTKRIKSLITQRMKDSQIQEWNANLRDNRLCINYRMFKRTYEPEFYLSLTQTYITILLVKYRTGSHSLPISDKRYLEIDDRNTCPLCDKDEVGDEYHYIFICPAFDLHRIQYISPYYRNHPNTLKFHSLFATKDIKKLIKLSKFVKEIMFVFRL